MTFTEAQHPRGQASNSGQFRAKLNDAPTGELVGYSGAFTAANARFQSAQRELQVEAVREMLRVAPARGSAIVFELLGEGDPETELFAFQSVVDEDGEDVAISRELRDLYFDLGSRVDFEHAEESGFERDGETFVLEVPDLNPESTRAALSDALDLHLYLAVNGTSEAQAASDGAVHVAARNHCRSLASTLRHPVDSIVFASGGGVGLHLVRTENADGTSIHDHMTYAHPSHAADRASLDEISTTASNFRAPALAGLTSEPGDGRFRLRLNP